MLRVWQLAMLYTIKISSVKWGHVGISETLSSGPCYSLWFHQDAYMIQYNASRWAAVDPMLMSWSVRVLYRTLSNVSVCFPNMWGVMVLCNYLQFLCSPWLSLLGSQESKSKNVYVHVCLFMCLCVSVYVSLCVCVYISMCLCVC